MRASTPLRIASTALICLLLTCCGTASNIHDYTITVLYAMQHKVLVFAPSPCSGPDHPDKPYLVSEWIREKDMKYAVIVCKQDCSKCWIEVRREGSVTLMRRPGPWYSHGGLNTTQTP